MCDNSDSGIYLDARFDEAGLENIPGSDDERCSIGAPGIRHDQISGTLLPTDWISSLPQELLCIIFSYISSPLDLARLAQVSKCFWSTATPNLYRRLSIHLVELDDTYEGTPVTRSLIRTPNPNLRFTQVFGVFGKFEHNPKKVELDLEQRQQDSRWPCKLLCKIVKQIPDKTLTAFVWHSNMILTDELRDLLRQRQPTITSSTVRLPFSEYRVEHLEEQMIPSYKLLQDLKTLTQLELRNIVSIFELSLAVELLIKHRKTLQTINLKLSPHLLESTGRRLSIFQHLTGVYQRCLQGTSEKKLQLSALENISLTGSSYISEFLGLGKTKYPNLIKGQSIRSLKLMGDYTGQRGTENGIDLSTSKVLHITTKYIPRRATPGFLPDNLPHLEELMLEIIAKNGQTPRLADFPSFNATGSVLKRLYLVVRRVSYQVTPRYIEVPSSILTLLGELPHLEELAIPFDTRSLSLAASSFPSLKALWLIPTGNHGVFHNRKPILDEQRERFNLVNGATIDLLFRGKILPPNLCLMGLWESPTSCPAAIYEICNKSSAPAKIHKREVWIGDVYSSYPSIKIFWIRQQGMAQYLYDYRLQRGTVFYDGI